MAAAAPDSSGLVALGRGQGVEVAPDLEIRMVSADDLREQDVNAHVVPPRIFERLVANIKKRGAMESMPYCAQPARKGPTEIVSGHHRVRAARAAELDLFPVLVDVSPLTRSEIVAKQLAHNALIGNDDPNVVKELVKQIETPDDLLTSGLSDEFLPSAESEAVTLFMPRVDFEFRTVSFTALPHQLDNLKDLIDKLDGRQDLVLVTMPDQFDGFVKAASEYARIKEIRSGGTAIAMLVEQAQNALRLEAGEPLESTVEDEMDWQPVVQLVGPRIPKEAADVVREALQKAYDRDDVTEGQEWQVIERWAAGYLAEP